MVSCPTCGGGGEVDAGSYYEPMVVPCGVCEGAGEVEADLKITTCGVLGMSVKADRAWIGRVTGPAEGSA